MKESTGEGNIMACDSMADGTINESITLDLCIPLDNSAEVKTADVRNNKGEIMETRLSETEGKTRDKQQMVMVHNEDVDTEVEDDENELIYSIDLVSNISLGDEMAKSASITEWDPNKITGVDDFVPAATSTQYINAIVKTNAGLEKTKVDNKLRVIPKNYAQAMTG